MGDVCNVPLLWYMMINNFVAVASRSCFSALPFSASFTKDVLLY